MATEVVLVNSTGTALDGLIQLVGGSGAPMGVSIDGAVSASATYSIAPNSSKKIALKGLSADTESGSVWVVPSGGGASPVPLAIFTYKPGSFTVSEGSVPATMGTAFRMYTEIASSPQIVSGVAIANATGVSGTVTLSLADLDGSLIQTSAPLTLLPYGRIQGFMEQFLPHLANQTRRGVLRITTNLSNIAVVGLRRHANDRSPVPDLLLSTVPPTSENSLSSTEDRFFPQLVNGQGFTTQMILYSGTSAETSQGQLRFVRPDGTPFDLRIQ